MREANPFGQEATVNIIETRPRNARIPGNVRAICILPDPKDRKANGSACFRGMKPVPPQHYHHEVEAARFWDA